jgi:hypothetical protein
MEVHDLGLPREADALGSWLGCTTTRNLRTRMWMIYGGVLIAIGFGCFAMPLIRPPQAGEETAVWVLFGILGGSSVVVGLILIIGPFAAAMFNEPEILHHFEQGIVRQKPSGIVIARWSDITDLEMREWYDHRHATETTIATFTVRGHSEPIRLLSDIEGAPPILAAARKSVANVRFTPWKLR